MAIRKWHPGKLVILWVWGCIVSGLLLTDFLSRPAASAPLRELLELAVSLVVLVALSAVTWRWLGGKDLA